MRLKRTLVLPGKSDGFSGHDSHPRPRYFLQTKVTGKSYRQKLQAKVTKVAKVTGEKEGAKSKKSGIKKHTKPLRSSVTRGIMGSRKEPP